MATIQKPTKITETTRKSLVETATAFAVELKGNVEFVTALETSLKGRYDDKRGPLNMCFALLAWDDFDAERIPVPGSQWKKDSNEPFDRFTFDGTNAAGNKAVLEGSWFNIVADTLPRGIEAEKELSEIKLARKGEIKALPADSKYREFGPVQLKAEQAYWEGYKSANRTKFRQSCGIIKQFRMIEEHFGDHVEVDFIRVPKFDEKGKAVMIEKLDAKTGKPVLDKAKKPIMIQDTEVTSSTSPIMVGSKHDRTQFMELNVQQFLALDIAEALLDAAGPTFQALKNTLGRQGNAGGKSKLPPLTPDLLFEIFGSLANYFDPEATDSDRRLRLFSNRLLDDKHENELLSFAEAMGRMDTVWNTVSQHHAEVVARKRAKADKEKAEKEKQIG